MNSTGSARGRQLTTYMRTHRPPRGETERRICGLYGIADAQASHGDPVALGAALLAGGCRLLQLRCKGWATSDVIVAARALVTMCRDTDATFLINDWPAIAVEVGADGVHIGATDLTAEAARAVVGPDLIIGRSTNAVDEVAGAAIGADYVAFGPLYETPHLSRPKAVQGVARLAEVRALLPEGVPLVGIGGINRARLDEVRAAGVDAWAVIGAVAAAADPESATRQLLG